VPSATCVLVVDDQETIRAALRRLVESWTPGRVAEAHSGERAAALAVELAPDLVLMDVFMPGVGGIRAAAIIKALRPRTAVLLVSSTHPDDLPPEAGRDADAVAWKGDLDRRLLDAVWTRTCCLRAGGGTAARS